ncbi:MAG TPA: hypothetical protein VKB75_01515 [Jatrophihabitans sp.]|nr:hypothetical protein [Jatrophihabitans sp.]
MNLTDAIRNLYVQVDAPAWAAPNLDGLVDVLRDLSWLPEGPVDVDPPLVDDVADARRLREALRHAAQDTANGPRPVSFATGEPD